MSLPVVSGEIGENDIRFRLIVFCKAKRILNTNQNVVGDLTAATFVARSEGYELLKTPENVGIG